MHTSSRNTHVVLAGIALLFILRLFHITDPPLEVAHNWRQTTSLMVARNFHQLDANILYPTIDETGESRGVIGMEFPAIPYAIHLVSIALGYDHWYGRLIVLILVSFGSWYFFLLARMFAKEKTAAWATLLYTASSLLHLGRKVMPDPAALSLVIIALYYGLNYLKVGGIYRLLAYLLFAALGTLIKIPFGLYLALLAIPFFNAGVPQLRKLYFCVASALVLLATGWWYFSWNPHLAQEYGQWYNSGKPLLTGLSELSQHPAELLERFYFSSFHSYVWGLVSLAGITVLLCKRSKVAIAVTLTLLPLIVLYMMKSGSLFTHHGYYALILVPWLAFSCALFLERINSRIAATILVVGCIESIANQQHDFFIKPAAFNKLTLESIADEIGSRADLVALVSNANPNEFYFLNRKGWLVSPDECSEDYLQALAAKGCRYLFVPTERQSVDLPFAAIYESTHYKVYRLN